MLEIKNTVTKIKKCFCWTLLDTAVERMSELEDYSIETPKLKNKQKKV